MRTNPPTPDPCDDLTARTYRGVVADLEQAAADHPGTIPTLVHLRLWALGVLIGAERRTEPRADGHTLIGEPARVTR